MPTAHITRDEELRLIIQAQAGDSTAEGALLEAHRGYVHAVAAKFGRPDIEADLAQAGLMGLMSAIRKFDTSRSVRLLTFAHMPMLEEMNETAADLSGAARVPGRIRRRFLKDPDLDANNYLAPVKSLDYRHPLTSTDGESSFLSDDLHGMEYEPYRGVSFAHVEDVETVRALLAVLEDLEREIVRRFFGFEGEPQSDAEIAEALGMAKTTVVRRRQAALVSMLVATSEG